MSIPKSSLVDQRGYLPEDRSFILATWLRGAYYGDTWFNQIPKNIFMEHYHAILEKFLNNPNVDIKVACLKDDPAVILGYSVSRVSQGQVVLDWIFTKSAWRNVGIGKSLVPLNLQAVTHLTKIGKALKPQEVVYNPFL